VRDDYVGDVLHPEAGRGCDEAPGRPGAGTGAGAACAARRCGQGQSGAGAGAELDAGMTAVLEDGERLRDHCTGPSRSSA
jgi:hypothetical protein